ncbi:hypothetical protein DPM19_19885 [Actinomadura craniellae]|uniref:DUF6879 domain-containing protein n=1 Tax=Actinomadura craniellae TaxID=2231787 RepID=A0A365H2R2_9ACTN|nr:DUF6879 family protein [Actinomadura craniellae]RAY13339.1 hypothetical protein DPM19_19885 [Actinomadura craniellae]
MDGVFPPAGALLLDLAGFLARADELWDSLGERVVKLERRQSYQEPGNPSYEALVAGDWDRAVELAAHTHDDDKATYDELRDKGVHFLRLRVVEPPTSEYVRWEFEHYRVTARLGEDIRVVEQADIADLDRSTGLSDFLLFDETAVLIHDYGTDGILCGGWLSCDPALIGRVAALVDSIIEVAEPFEDYLARVPRE